MRDPFFDNAKMLLVGLVVVGHSWMLLPETFVTSWAYNFLYLWHVPAFVMVTGYLSRSFTFSRRDLVRLATTVVLPYLVFEALLAAFRQDVGGEDLARCGSTRTGRCGTSRHSCCGGWPPRCCAGCGTRWPGRSRSACSPG